MDQDALRTLRMLDELSQGKRVTQRQLSKQLGVALGLTNLFVRRLVRKGYVKVVNVQTNRLRYLLTPKGVAEKAALTARYVRNSFRYYRSVRAAMRQAFADLASNGCRRIVFRGAGEEAEIAYLSLREAGLELVAVVDERQSDRNFCGHPVLGLEALRELEFDKLVIIGQERTDGQGQFARAFGIPRGKIFRLALRG